MARLSPPWYTLWNKVKYSIGEDPEVVVGDLQTQSDPFIIPIRVDNRQKAQALASIMNPSYSLGNIHINVEISDSSGKIISPINPTSPEQLSEMVQTGLQGNHLFLKVVTQPLFPNARLIVFPVFKKEVIQFYNDDLSDLYNNFNNVAALVFQNVLKPAPGGISLDCSTEKSD